MTTVNVPSLMVINATSLHHHFPETHYDLLTHENVGEFLEKILQNDIAVNISRAIFVRSHFNNNENA